MNLYTAGSITVAAMELARYKFDLVVVQEFSWDKGGNVRAGIIIFYMKEERKSSLGHRIFCTPQNSISI